MNRLKNERGWCLSGPQMKVASYDPHYGEEPEIVGFSASGTIFLSGCNLLCHFCQNHDISHLQEGKYISEEVLAEIMLKMQENGYSNVNFVTPTHWAPQLLKTITFAKTRGFKLPIVYNSSGYELDSTIKLFDGLVDIYMPDLKFFNPQKSKRMANAPDYFEHAGKVIIEMHRQVGDLIIENEVAKKGLLIRHLVLPDNQSDTKQIIDFIADKPGTNTYLNLMDQYYPAFRAQDDPLISRRISKDEFEEYIDYARQKGFTRPDYLYTG